MRKLGIDSYSYHRFYGEVHASQSDPGVIWQPLQLYDHLESQFQVDGYMVDTFVMSGWDEAMLRQLRARFDVRGLERCLSWGHPRGLDAGRSPAAEQELMQHIDACAALGAHVLRIVSGGYSTALEEPRAVQMERLAPQLRRLGAYASQRGVKLALENHWDFTAAEMLQLLESVQEEQPLYVTYDCGNALRVGDDPVEAARLLGPHTAAVHIKDIGVPLLESDDRRFNSPCVPIGSGLIDIPGVFAALDAAGYDGLYAIEIDSPRGDLTDEDEIIARSLAYMRTL